MYPFISIYDFELYPYALGDVLTWNIRSAIKCQQAGLDKVQIYICVDRKSPVGIFQKNIINQKNYQKFFSDLRPAFDTHPCLQGIEIFESRALLISRLENIYTTHPKCQDEINLYRRAVDALAESKTQKAQALDRMHSSIALNTILPKILPRGLKTFIKRVAFPYKQRLIDHFSSVVSSHLEINKFYEITGSVPVLCPQENEVVELTKFLQKEFKNKCIVAFHCRLRALDLEYGGEESYHRDSSFFEWYEFLLEAQTRHPNVVFFAMGRAEEKPKAMMRLRNVYSLRDFGMNLGHELALILSRADFFLGSSSGFAACANFSKTPYAITKMTDVACGVYDISFGDSSLPFASESQVLIYKQETSELLETVLEKSVVSADEWVSKTGAFCDSGLSNEFNSFPEKSRIQGEDGNVSVNCEDIEFKELRFLLCVDISRSERLDKEEGRSYTPMLRARIDKRFKDVLYS